MPEPSCVRCSANSDYRDIRIDTDQLKVVVVSLRGSVPDAEVIDRLLVDLSRSDFVRYCSLHGRCLPTTPGELMRDIHSDGCHRGSDDFVCISTALHHSENEVYFVQSRVIDQNSAIPPGRHPDAA